MPGPFDPNNPNLTIDTSFDKQDRTFNISVAIHSLDTLTAKQADTYLKELIAQALKTAVMERYGAIQRLVDEFIHSGDVEEKIQSILLEEFRKRAAEHVKSMFG